MLHASYWFSIATRYLPLGAVFTLAACQAQPARVSPPAHAFSKGRKLTYQVAWAASGSQQAQLDTLVLSSFGFVQNGRIDTFQTAHFALITRQTNVGYSYDAHATPNSFSGVIEHDSLLWSHPPRDGAYAVLELSPFPYIQLPARAGHQWTWDLTVGDSWSNPKWATWRGLIQVRSQYQVVGQQALRTPLGLLQCWVVRARASCPVGSSRLDLWYHPAYGFVRLDYHTINDSRLTFNLVGASIAHHAEPFSLPGYQPYQLLSPK